MARNLLKFQALLFRDRLWSLLAHGVLLLMVTHGTLTRIGARRLPIFVCPSVAEWTNERNGSYGYNYQFSGNARLSTPGDIHAFKNWPVALGHIGDTARTVADCMGTAKSSTPRRDSRHNPSASHSTDPQ